MWRRRRSIRGALNDWPSDFRRGALAESEISRGTEGALRWLCVSQDSSGVGGSGARYLPIRGRWDAPYPETTGYIITTFLDAASRFEHLRLVGRAEAMGNWLLGLQLESGAFPGGTGVSGEPSVFNTAQIMDGLLSLHEHSSNDHWESAILKAGHWMSSVQDSDGKWSSHIYDRSPRTYMARAAWPLLRAGIHFNDLKMRSAAESFFDWALSDMDDDGYFRSAGFDQEGTDGNVLHTVGYVLEGFLRAGVLVGNQTWIDASSKGAIELATRMNSDHVLGGEYAPGWSVAKDYVLPTGVAQLAVVWGLLFEARGDELFEQAANLAISGLLAVQAQSGSVNLRGGFPGSIPLGGEYQPDAFPNWAAKFFVDAGLITLQR